MAALTVVLFGQKAWAQSPSCDDPPSGSGACLPWGFIDLRSEPLFPVVDLSRDGSVLVGSEPGGFWAGYNGSDYGGSRVDRWKLGAGRRILGPLGNSESYFTAINGYSRVLSANGQFVLVEFDAAWDEDEDYDHWPWVTGVVRWDAESGDVVEIPANCGGSPATGYPCYSSMLAPTPYVDLYKAGTTISSDGNQVAGIGYYMHEDGDPQGQNDWSRYFAYHWVAGSGLSDAPQIAFGGASDDPSFWPGAIAANGAIAGSLLVDGHQVAAVWSPGSGGTVLGSPNSRRAREHGPSTSFRSGKGNTMSWRSLRRTR